MIFYRTPQVLLFIPACLGLFLISYSQNSNEETKLEIQKTKTAYLASVERNREFELIDLQEFPALAFDIKYATANNFTETVIYRQEAAFCRRPVAFALLNANLSLLKKGYRIKVFDAYRPYSATVFMFGVAKRKEFVASPKYGSRHNRGCAVDITLVDAKTGKELPMPTAYDDFTEKAAPDYMDLNEEILANRTLLLETMIAHGFEVFHNEWWHYDYIGWEEFPLMDLTFEELKN